MDKEYFEYADPFELETYSRQLIEDAGRKIGSIEELALREYDQYTLEELNIIEVPLNDVFQRATELNTAVPSVSPKLDVAKASAYAYDKILSIRKFMSEHRELAFPPEYVFPRNPNLAQYLTPKSVVDESYKDDGSGLKFELGFTGTMNIIRTKFPPYLDKSYYDYVNKQWAADHEPIVINIGANKNVVDITPYFSSSIVNFSGNATGINDKISYYFDGEKIVTNYDFTNIEERKLVKVSYKKLLNSLRVKAVMKTNMSGLSYYTPVVDQFTLLVDKQRVLN